MKRNNKPLIAVTCDYDMDKKRLWVDDCYFESIAQAGGIPMLVPFVEPVDALSLLEKADGLLITGGNDIVPEKYGEEIYYNLKNLNPMRDKLEYELFNKMFKEDKPVLGICRGCQLMNVAAGGSLYQDIETEFNQDNLVKHNQDTSEWEISHKVTLKKGSKLEEIFKSEVVETNSLHHQAIKKLAKGFEKVAYTDDGIIEGIEFVGKRFNVGVQWHPERMWQHYPNVLTLFKAFVNACK